MLRKVSHALYEKVCHCDPPITAEIPLDAGQFKERATRYRQLAETLLDESIVAVVLECARELEETAAILAVDHW